MASLVIEHNGEDPAMTTAISMTAEEFEKVCEKLGPCELVRGEVVEKTGECLCMGVDRVWVVDPGTRRLQVFRPDGEPTALSEDETLTDDRILLGFSCSVGEFFAD